MSSPTKEGEKSLRGATGRRRDVGRGAGCKDVAVGRERDPHLGGS